MSVHNWLDDKILDKYKKQVDVKPAGQPEQASCDECPKSRVVRMLQRSFLNNVNDTRALVGLCLLVTSRLGQIRDAWHF